MCAHNEIKELLVWILVLFGHWSIWSCRWNHQWFRVYLLLALSSSSFLWERIFFIDYFINFLWKIQSLVKHHIIFFCSNKFEFSTPDEQPSLPIISFRFDSMCWTCKFILYHFLHKIFMRIVTRASTSLVII